MIPWKYLSQEYLESTCVGIGLEIVGNYGRVYKHLQIYQKHIKLTIFPKDIY
jgi:hypothetical protein